MLRFYDRKAALLAKSRFSSYDRVFFQKPFVSWFRQEDAARQRLKGRRDGIAGGALAVSSRDDGAAAIHRAEGYTSGAAVNEVRFCLLGQLAMGKMAAVGADCLRAGQTVVDVGIHVNEEGKLCGDVQFAAAEPVVDAITPVPGGVGTVTTSVLVGHVVQAACKKAGVEC